MYCLTIEFAKVRDKITNEQYSYYISELQTVPEKIQKILEDKERILWFAAKYAMCMMCSLLAVVSTMQSVWKVA